MPTVHHTLLLEIPGFHLAPTGSNGMMMIVCGVLVRTPASRIMCDCENRKALTGSVLSRLIPTGKQMTVRGCCACTTLHPPLCVRHGWNLELEVRRIWIMREANHFFTQARFRG